MRVLVVGDDQQSAAFVRQTLQVEGFATDVSPHDNGATLYAVAILACPESGCNGACPLRSFRTNNHRQPVLVIAAHATAEMQVKCLDAGADDFLAASDALPVLPARVRALIRRTDGSRCSVLSSRLEVGDLSLDLKRRMATRAGKLIALSPRETELLEYLMDNAGKVCRRKDIFEQAWGYRPNQRTSVLDTNINRLREKLDVGFETQLIQTVHGKGYMLKALE